MSDYEECRNRAEQLILKWWMMGGNTVPMPPISDPLATLADLIAKELERGTIGEPPSLGRRV